MKLFLNFLRATFVALFALLGVMTAAHAGVYEVERIGCKVEGEARWTPCVLVRIDGKTYKRDYGAATFHADKAAKAAQAEFGHRFKAVLRSDAEYDADGNKISGGSSW